MTGGRTLPIRAAITMAGVVFATALLGPAWLWRGGLLEFEALAFLTHYNSPKPFLHQIFDPRETDFGAYQARELSYVVDALDARFYDALANVFGIHVFIALSALLASALMVAIVLWGIRRTMPRVDALAAALLTACLVTSFQFMSTAGIYYRSSKLLLTVTVLAFLFHVRRAGTAPGRHDALIAGVLCVVAGSLDRQGFFYVIVAGAMFGLHYFLTRQRRDWLLAVVSAAAFLVIYNLVLAPSAVYLLNGYWPDFAYQARSLKSPALLWQPWYFWRAFVLMAANIAGVFGGSQMRGVAVIVLTVAGVLTLAHRRGSGPDRVAGYCAVVLLAQLIMFALMIHQHPPIDQYVDHRYWYYPLPFIGTVIFAAALWLDTIGERLTAWQRRVVTMTLLAAVIGNVASLGRDRQVMTTGPYFSGPFQQSELLKKSFEVNAPDSGLERDYREFFDRQRR